MMGVWSVQLKKLWKSGTAEREGLVRPYIPTRFFKIVKTPLWITCQPHHFQSSSAVPGNDSSSGWLNFLRELINSTSIVLCETKYFLGEGGGGEFPSGNQFCLLWHQLFENQQFPLGKNWSCLSRHKLFPSGNQQFPSGNKYCKQLISHSKLLAKWLRK